MAVRMQQQLAVVADEYLGDVVPLQLAREPLVEQERLARAAAFRSSSGYSSRNVKRQDDSTPAMDVPATA